MVAQATLLAGSMAPVASSSGRCIGSATALSFRSNLGCTAQFRVQQRTCLRQRELTLQVEDAITRAKKEETVANLVQGLQSSAVVFGMRHERVKVKQLQEFRRKLPEGAKLVVAKNTLMGVAADQVEGWQELKSGFKKENAWVFIGEDCIAESVKAFMDFEAGLLAAIPKEQRASAKPTDISIGVMDNKPLDMAGIKKLEKLPTKAQLITTIAILIKKVPTKVAVAIKQVPTKVAFGVKALADGDEDKARIVGELFPKPATE
ncbi:hypothetical protein WJX72_005529 [[Myrmecia] bisecta]|uniref:50S ribosomal protein L10 n=1 Tax=[Myrmecia] bisecta TaxID=41462 RepID=A0AAW1Q143_9CHLO